MDKQIKKKRRKPFHHLDQSKRDRMQILLGLGYQQKDVARVLKVDKSTVSREVKYLEKQDGLYDAEASQHKATDLRRNSKYAGMKVEDSAQLKEYVTNQLKKRRSPDEIAGRMKAKGQSFYASKHAIYKWLYSAYGQAYCKHLCTKRYRPKKRKENLQKRQVIQGRISLDLRPRAIGLRHGEGDTFLSPKRAQTKVSVAMVCEIESKLLAGNKISSLKPKIMKRAIKKINRRINLDSLTLDNGQENRQHQEFGVSTYFCNPHSPWQKPHIENGIGLLRKWFVPKGTDLSKLSNWKLQKYIAIINNKYRKSLGYRSAYEVALERGILKNTNPPVAFHR